MKRLGGYLAMRTDVITESQLMESDGVNTVKVLGVVARQVAGHALKISGLGFGTTVLKWVASFAAIYLLILNLTNWKTNMLTCLLVPYILFTLPSIIFNALRGEVAKWVSIIAVIFRLFFPSIFPDWLEMPSSFVLIMAAAPSLVADRMRDDVVGAVFCLGIGCYLFQEHNRASGGFKKSLTHINGIANTLGIAVLLVYPIWRLVLFLF